MITKQPVLNIGLVGHIDHGKTTVLHRLSGVWADKHSEELKRGITIKLGYADVTIYKDKEYNIEKKGKPVKYISFIDAPGHEMLMATMLGGAAVIDAAILVIAANETFPQPQTKEHLLALEAKGITEIIIVQNKIDLTTKEQAKEQHKKIKEYIKETIAKNAVIIPVCAQQNININKIFEQIDKIPIPKRDEKSDPIFLIARSFDINKPGKKIKDLNGGILGGVLKQGTLKVGDEIEIKPGISMEKHGEKQYKTVKTKIVKIMSGDNDLKEALPSGSLAIQTALDPFITKSDSLSGCVASTIGKLPEISSNIQLKTNLFKEIVGLKDKVKIDPIKMNEPLMLSANTTTTIGFVKKIKPDEISLSLKIPVVPFKKERVGIARNYQGHWRLIGWGEIF
ncbi:MAG: translation initiation factor IF-2 subunit gamma [archaeon]